MLVHYIKLFYPREMATQLRIALATCLLLFILMEDAKPVLAGTGGKRIIKLLQAKVSALEEAVKCKRKYT